MATIPVTIDTPCGPKTISVPIPINIPTPPDLLGFLQTLLNVQFPPRLPLITPPCSIVEHTGSAPEPPEDSLP
jgi:hypothetical protein